MSGQFEIRTGTTDDAAALSLLGQATFLEAFAGILNGPDILAHCARRMRPCVPGLARGPALPHLAGARTAGPGSGGLCRPGASDLPVPDPHPGEVEVKRVYLLNRFQGSGLGKLLMSHAIERARAEGARRLLLGVYSENAGAIAFYQRLGFETIGHRPFTVGTMVYDDFVMSLAL